MADRYRFKELLKQHRDKKRSTITSGIIGGGMLFGGGGALAGVLSQSVGPVLTIFGTEIGVPSALAWLPGVSLGITNPLLAGAAAVLAAVGGTTLIMKIVNDKKNNKLVSEFGSYTGTLSANAQVAARIVYIPVIFFLKRMGQLDYQKPEIVLRLGKTYGFEEAEAEAFIKEYGGKSEDELKDIMGRLDSQEEGLEDLSFLVAAAIKECKEFRNLVGQEKSKADECIKEIESCLCKGIDWTRLENAFIILLVSRVIPATIFLRENVSLSESTLKDELHNLGLKDEDLEKKLVSKDPEKIRREQEALIRILANNLVHDPGTIASKQDLYSLPKKIVAEAETVCLQLNAKHFEPRLHPRNKLYIEGECSKLEKLILKELRGYSAEVVQVVHQSAEINVQQINDLNAFVEGLAKFTVEREQELEQVIYDINEKIRRVSDDTGAIIAEDKKSIENIWSQMAELRQRAKERS
ncbi:MAG: hypothetical protein IJW57_04255 [Spirochaetaceae bacterium]|nr:hypothetical protein [Spirochaetaceae bacterium]